MEKAVTVAMICLLATPILAGPSLNIIFGQSGGVSASLLADVSGWNYTITDPSKTNPTIASARLFVGQPFTARIIWVNDRHNLAVYAPGTPLSQVDPASPCEMTPGCIVESSVVAARSPETLLTFSMSTFGLYEYYCEFHPDTMHGKIRILKSPDINNDKAVNILDLVIVAGVLFSTPDSPNWKPEADLNFDNVVNILDLVIVAANMFRTL